MVKTPLPALVAALLTSVLTNVAEAQQTVLYDFWSPTCGPCRRMEPTVSRLVSAGFPVQKVNIMGSSEERAIAAKYRVQRVPCFVMVAGGQEVDRVVGSTSYSRLEQMVRRATTAGSAGLPVARAQSPDAMPTLPADSPWARHAPEAAHGQPRSISWPATESGAPASSESNALSAADSPGNSSIYTRSNEGSNPTSPSDSEQRHLIEVSVRLRVGDATGHSWGTGTIIDARSGEALVVTCGHLFRDMHAAPDRDWKVEVELFEWTPTGPRVVDQIPGEVIRYDLESDVGLVSIRPGRHVAIARVAGPRMKVTENLAVRSVGCDHGADPTVIPTHVTAINRYLGPPNIETAGAPVVGRSGGGLFNPQNELIGICNAAEPEGNEGLYAGLEAIHQMLNQIGLSEICLRDAPPIPATASGPSISAATGEPFATIVRGQEPGQFEQTDPSYSSHASTQEAGPSQPATQPEPDLSATESAAWDEIMARAAEAEVVCIVRPKDPSGQSEIITLNQVSAEFVRRLREAHQAGAAGRGSADDPPIPRTDSGTTSAASPWGAAR